MCLFVRIILDPASPPEELGIRVFCASLQITGGVSRAHEHLKQHGLKRVAVKELVLTVKKGCFLHYY